MLGRLMWSTGNPNLTRYLYDGDALVAEYDYGGNLVRRYVHGANSEADDPLIWYDVAGTAAADRRNLLSDHQGSIVAVSDNAGTRLSINRYDEYGIPATANTGRFQYTGQAWLGELGMYYYKARIYSPTLGRFLQVDPIGYEGGINLYAYVDNDPINAIDPNGENPLVGAVLLCIRYCRAVISGGARLTRWVLTRPAARTVARSSVMTGRAASAAFQAAWRRAGFSSADDVGRVIGWGRGPNSASQALARIGQINRSTVAAMRERGLTREVVTAARDLYRTAVREGTGGATAAARLQLME